MKKTLLILLVLSISIVLHSQNENPFAKFGYDVLVATSSKGEFQEFHDQTDVVEIGSVLFNRRTNEIVKVLDKDETTIDISSATAAMSIDPLCEKYYWISPYVYCANNPLKYIDPDGRKIIPVNVTKRDGRGQPVGESGLSRKTNAAMTDIMKTSEGRAFFGKFAEKGQILGGYTFTENGKYSDTNLTIYDYSWSKETGNVMPSGAEGSLNVSEEKNGKMSATLKVSSSGMNQHEIGEVVTHETQLHGYKSGDKIDGKKVAGQDVDHSALKNKDTKHKGYSNYNSVRQQLETIDEKYKAIFKEAEEHAKRNY